MATDDRNNETTPTVSAPATTAARAVAVPAPGTRWRTGAYIGYAWPVMLRARVVPLLFLAMTVACDRSSSEPSPPAPAPAQPPAQTAAPAHPTSDSEQRKNDPAAEPTSVTAEVGEAAPEFELVDLDGKKHRLSSYRDKVVVLEWFNPECPFVKSAHGEGALRTMAADAADDDLVWLAVNSGGEGKQGHGVEKNKTAAETFKMAHPILLDEDGAVGHAYGATKTPSVVIVGKDGTVVFSGGIDNAPMGELDGEGPLIEYAKQALAEVRAGRPVTTARARPYGCTVKFAS